MGKRTELRLKREQQKRKATITVVVGLGAITLAIVALMLLPSAKQPAAQKEFSAIPVELNYPAPELALKNLTGQTESLADFLGKVVLVNNWATWCPPCKAEMPTLLEFYNEYAHEGLIIIAIEAGDSKEQVQQFVMQLQIPFSVWLDPDGKALNTFKNGNLPNSYVIDRTGTVRLAWTGQVNRETLEKYVTPLLSDN